MRYNSSFGPIAPKEDFEAELAALTREYNQLEAYRMTFFLGGSDADREVLRARTITLTTGDVSVTLGPDDHGFEAIEKMSRDKLSDRLETVTRIIGETAMQIINYDKLKAESDAVEAEREKERAERRAAKLGTDVAHA